MAEYAVCPHCHNPLSQHEWVKVVRCKDCKLTAPYGDGIECCGPLVQTWDYFNDEPMHNPVEPDGFCKWGVRRESE